MKTGNKKGGGLGSKVHKEVGNRFGAKASNLNPRAVSQIGQSVGNKATDSGGKTVSKASEVMRRGALPAALSVPLGNELAAKGLGVGGGRKLYGQSGSNQTYGKPAIGLGRIASTKGQWPD